MWTHKIAVQPLLWISKSFCQQLRIDFLLCLQTASHFAWSAGVGFTPKAWPAMIARGSNNFPRLYVNILSKILKPGYQIAVEPSAVWKTKKIWRRQLSRAGWRSLYKRLIEGEVASSAHTKLYKPLISMHLNWPITGILVNHWLRLFPGPEVILIAVFVQMRWAVMWATLLNMHCTTPYSNHVTKYWNPMYLWENVS